MSHAAQNNIRIRSPAINKIINSDRYSADDVTEAEQKYIERHTPKPRIQREDLQCGDLVVILEGGFMGKKAIFVKQADNFTAIIVGIKSVNGVPLVKIDERYLLKLDVSLPLSNLPDIDESSAVESKIGESERMEEESAADELENAILAAVQKVKFMKAYIAKPFSVDESTDFYSQKY